MSSQKTTYKMFTVDVTAIEGHNGKCGGCNWEARTQYALAQSQKEAERLVKDGEAGLCGDCMCDMLANDDAPPTTLYTVQAEVLQVKVQYVCPDCKRTVKSRAHRIRCSHCGSLNLERKLADGRLIKADADENTPEGQKLIHKDGEPTYWQKEGSKQ